MIENQIRAWIDNGGSFRAGMTLLAQANPTLHTRLSPWLHKPMVPSEVKDRLRKILSRYATSPTIGQNAPATQQDKPEPEAVRRLRHEGRMKLKEYDQHKTLLRHLAQAKGASNDDRYQVARAIMEKVIPEADAIYDRIRAYEQRGELPTIADSELVRQTVDKMQRIQSLRPRISRLKKWLDKKDLDVITRRKYELELAEKEKELDALEVELKLK